MNYETEPMGDDSNPYYRCVSCKKSVPEITISGHRRNCHYYLEELPEEALVLLDEALEALPSDLELWDWDDFELPFRGPKLSSERCIDGQTRAVEKPTWTVRLHRNKDPTWNFELLEWWDDHWVHLATVSLDDRRWQVIWEGRKLTP